MTTESSINFLQTNITAKLRFPSPLTDGYWAVEELIQKKLYAVPFLGALIVVACAQPISKSDLFQFLTLKKKMGLEKLEGILENLISKGIIISIENQGARSPLFDNFLNWVRSGWENAAYYHFFTWDTPFLDYTKEGEGYEIDRKKMKDYESVEPDVKRFKKYEVSKRSLKLTPVESLVSGDQIKNYSICEKTKYLLSFVFGKKGEKECHWNNTPLIRRTSPSGGSRHPTEGYFISMTVQGIEKGFYHIQTDPVSLVLISANISSLSRDLIAKDERKVYPIGSIVLTSVFERNMYRYREPRTFRTIHMDIGHILATIETLGRELGIKTEVHLNCLETSFLEHIGASTLDEGVMAAVTLYEENVKK